MIRALRAYSSGAGLGPKLVRAVVAGTGIRIAGMAFGFLVGVQLARGLGAEGMGVYGLAMSMVALLAVPTEFGLPQLVTRELAAAQVGASIDAGAALLRWCRRMVVVTSVLIATALGGWLLASDQLHTPLGLSLMAGSIAIPLIAMGSIDAAALRGLQYLVHGQLPDALLRPLAQAALLAVPLLLSVPLTPPLAMLAAAAAAAIGWLCARWMLASRLPPVTAAPLSSAESFAAWRSALPMAMTEGMRVLQGHMAIFMLGALAPLASVGIFRVASSVAVVIAVPLTLFNVIAMPVIARLHAEGDQARLQRLLGVLALGMAGGCTALSLPFWLAGEPLLVAVFGREFAASHWPLVVLSTATVVNGVFGANAAMLSMTRHAGRVTRASACALVLLAVLSALLVPRWDELGAALAWAASMTLWNLLMWWDVRRLLNLDTGLWSIARRRLHA